VSRDPKNALAFYNLGMALKQQDQFADAEQALRQAIAIDPSLPDAPYTLGVVLWQTGRGADALAEFRKTIALNPEFADAHYMLATVLKQQGDADGAAAGFRRAIALRPTSAEAHLSLGQVLQQRGDTAGAGEAFAEAERLRKLKADAQASTFAVGVGREKLKQRDLTGAIAQFREAIRLAADNPQAHYQLALALRQAGREADARPHFAEAQRLSPWLKPPPLTSASGSSSR
jgi:protein O-GlcNAc transferase